MVNDTVYELCLPVLRDDSLDDEERTEKLEELLRKETTLTGKPLEDAILDSLWRYREGANTSASLRLLDTSSSEDNRQHPGNPSLNAYEFSESSPAPDIYGDFGNDTVDWLVNEDTISNDSSSCAGDGMNVGAAEWVPSLATNMDPFDMVRSILRDDRSNEDIEEALEASGYDLGATLTALMGASAFEAQQAITTPDLSRSVLVGKSMSPSFRPATPVGQQKTNVLCKYWLQYGQCARADCRFSHDPSKMVCKYWLNGNCLAGDTCMFSHDPSIFMARMMLDAGGSTPPMQPNFQLQDYDSFPSLQPFIAQQYTPLLQQNMEPTALEQMYGLSGAVAVPTPPPGLSPRPHFAPLASNRSLSHSRPISRPQSRVATPSLPASDDNEAFPTLGAAAAVKAGKKHHGKRGGHVHREPTGPSSLADVVRMSPSPSPSAARKAARPAKTGTRENSNTSHAIPAPEHIPWLETGESANKAYLKARAEAFKHGGLRNKFLQSAAQAWNRKDSKAARALSNRGQSENVLMREAHREAARILYEERNKDSAGPGSKEIYVDLHGLHPEEAVSYLEAKLLAHSSSPAPVYAITGTGHHSKNGKDKVGKAVRAFLTEWRYSFREFSVPGDRGNVGGILGIDPSSWDRSLGERRSGTADGGAGDGEAKGRARKSGS
ncbi:hypothetical protein H2199_001415 [Coniosporium tulheliwenetii]|uniref:Uncharacterized protein n=1 Tax=Coniosporium tulheliwenetii TaxID=3383036 RepID=A0ACC2ZLT9_9PEZI|nr:hypothetical protein H2199_001415 [Cladosporium sp. JES 115]